ncbi:Gfo/Idh/MocA family oxidoreductase [Candidatus Peribacteria bacterium]|nr:Gfo/Idh/MocA family oxidoreductase [Candidatus Peribacteria bacterium]
MKQLSVAIVGLGYWGPNWLRNFSSLEDCDLKYGCDLSKDRCAKFLRLYPGTVFTQRYEDLLKDKTLDAIVIATPTSSHFSLAKAALEAGKHVLIEKPMTSTSAEGKKLVALAKKKKLQLLVDHTFAYTSSVTRIAELVKNKQLGDLLYFDSTRINLGLIQKDTNVLWDLAIHDLAILSAIANLEDITEIMATGSAHYGRHVEDAHLHLKFSSGLAAHIHTSWLSPVKIRKTLIAGRKAMIVYDDTEPSEKIRIYDKGIDSDTMKSDPFFPKYRSGDVVIPALLSTEALAVEARHFLQCITGKEKSKVSGEDGLRLVRILEAADESLGKNHPITL